MANSAQAAVTLIAVSVLLIGGLAIATTGYETAGDQRTINNETFTPSTSFVDLNFSNIENTFYSDRVTVFDENGTEMLAGVDYDWNSSDGTVAAVAGGDLEGDNNGTISYTIYRPTEEQQTVQTALATIFSGGQWVPVLLLVALLIFAFGALSNL